VTADGRYGGGAILPGSQTFADSLSRAISPAEEPPRLPVLNVGDLSPALADDAPWGQDTRACLESGFRLGYGGALKGILWRLAGTLGAEGLIVTTGGLAEPTLQACGVDVQRETGLNTLHDPLLTLKGLNAL